MEDFVNIQELNERIARESAFVDALTLELRKFWNPLKIKQIQIFKILM